MAPDAIVALTGTSVLAGWAVGLSIPTLFLGGICDPHPLPMVRIGISSLVEELVHRLINLGHRHLVMPLCGRSASFSELIKSTIQSAVIGRESAGMQVHVLETPYSTPEVLYDVLKKHWRHFQPDSMMLLDWREFVAASAFFRDSQINIPKDISVALLSNDNSMDWHLPKLSHYEFSTMKLAKAVARWAVDSDPQSNSMVRVTMRAQWREGGSILDRR